MRPPYWISPSSFCLTPISSVVHNPRSFLRNLAWGTQPSLEPNFACSAGYSVSDLNVDAWEECFRAAWGGVKQEKTT